MSRHIDEIEFTVFDTETTGLDPKSGDRIVELAAVRVKGENKISAFGSLINPGYPVSPEAFRVNNISASLLAPAPEPREVIPDFMDFMRGSCLCSYNAGFDLGFLNNELRILGRDPVRDMPVVDILAMARRLIPGLERYALAAVAGRLGVEVKQAHRASADVELALGVFYRLKEVFKAKETPDFDKFLKSFAVDPLLY